METFGLSLALTKLREDQNLTQQEAGQTVNVSGATWSRWESGQHHPTTQHLKAIAETFDVDPVALFEGSVTERSNKLRERALRAREELEGVIGSVTLGEHHIELLEDGSILVNSRIRVMPEVRQ